MKKLAYLILFVICFAYSCQANAEPSSEAEPDVNGSLELGLKYYFGDGKAKDSSLADKHFRKALELSGGNVGYGGLTLGRISFRDDIFKASTVEISGEQIRNIDDVTFSPDKVSDNRRTLGYSLSGQRGAYAPLWQGVSPIF
jgi:hypothetical protein